MNEPPDRADLVERLNRLRTQAIVHLALAMGWLIIAGFHAGYLTDTTVQAIALDAYLPQSLRAFALSPAWIFLAIALADGAMAFVALRLSQGTLIPFAYVERLRIHVAFAVAAAVSFLGSLAYVAAALSVLYYLYLAPSGR